MICCSNKFYANDSEPAPGEFTISKIDNGLTIVNIEVTKPVDPEQEQLSYFTVNAQRRLSCNFRLHHNSKGKW
jgi:hypothetical protein